MALHINTTTPTTTTKSTDLDGLRKRLLQRVERLKSELQEAETHLQAVNTTADLLGQSRTERVLESCSDAYLSEFEGMTQVQGLIKIAKDNGNNRFRLTKARDTLIAAGLIKSKKNASNILWNAIQRSERFKRVAPGEYELISEGPIVTNLKNNSPDAILVGSKSAMIIQAKDYRLPYAPAPEILKERIRPKN